MWRGTTPTHTFTLPDGMSAEDFSTAYITYSQNGCTVLEKTVSDIVPGYSMPEAHYQHIDEIGYAGGDIAIVKDLLLN